MPGLIRSNSPEVTQRRPMLGFTVRTGGHPFFEVAVVTRPELFRPDGRAGRRAQTFYSTRAQGPLRAERGEAVYMLPPDVLSRFAGQERLYFAVATFPDATRNGAEVRLPAPDLAPYVTVSRSFTGRPARSMVGVGTGRRGSGIGGYGSQGSPAELEWAGDAAQPGAQPMAPAAPANGNGANGKVNENGSGATADASPALAYDDGFDASLWERPLEAAVETDPDAMGIDGPVPA